MAERVHRLRIAGTDESGARGGVDLPAGNARTQRGNACVHRRPERVPRQSDVLRRGRLALVEEVPDALQVARVLGTRDAEVDVQELTGAGAQLARRRMSDLLLRPGVDRWAVVAAPGVAEAAPRDLRVHDVRDVELGQPGPQCSRDEVEDLLGLAHRLPDEVDLHGRLAAPERVDDRRRRDETVRESAVRECLLELEPEPVRQAVRGRVAPRVVERDRARREAFQRLTQRGLDALVVADHVVAADLLDGRCVEAADDRDSLARRRDDERARPGAVRPRDQVETRVAREHRLANEREPDVRRPARAGSRPPARASPGRGSTSRPRR